MKKVILILLAIFMMVGFTACGTKTEVDLAALKTEISELFGEDASDTDVASLPDIYGFAKEDIADAFCFIKSDELFVREAIVVKATDEAAAKRIGDILQDRFSQIFKDVPDMDTETLADTMTCKVTVVGNYVSFFTAPEHAKMDSAFSSLF